MNIWNANLVRTLLTVAALLLPALTVIFGCESSGDGLALVCRVEWLTPKMSILVSSGLLVANILLKAWQGGAFGTGLVAPTVPVVDKPQAGTVTPGQVRTTK